MLTYFQFLLLSLNEKRRYLKNEGTFLLSYQNEQGVIHLYAAGDFFVELNYNEQQDCTTQVLAFKNSARLQQHADHVDLALLMSA